MNGVPPARLDTRSVRRGFERAIQTYAGAAALQTESRQELLARLDFFALRPATVADLGAGLGEGGEALRQRFPDARIVEVDLAHAMLTEHRRSWRFWRRRQAVCADVRQLPLPDRCVDLAFSNLMLQWCDEPALAFAEIARVLKPGGLLLASTFGPLTLQELRAAWAGADDRPHVSDFPDLPQLATALGVSGFQEPVLDRDLRTEHHRELSGIMRELRDLGARNAARDRRRALTGTARWRRMAAGYEQVRTSGGLPVTWELIYMAAFAGDRSAASLPVGERRIDVGSIGRRHRP